MGIGPYLQQVNTCYPFQWCMPCLHQCLSITHYRWGIILHLPKTQVNRANIQNIPVVKNGSLMGNKGHVYGVRTFTDSKNTLLGTCPEIQGTLNRCLFRKKRD